jgi:hypothetical protein
MNRHECIGGCGTLLPFPGERCKDCEVSSRDLRKEWGDASKSANDVGRQVVREIRGSGF